MLVIYGNQCTSRGVWDDETQAAVLRSLRTSLQQANPILSTAIEARLMGSFGATPVVLIMAAAVLAPQKQRCDAIGACWLMVRR
jgi:hypothetical protein